MTDDHDIDLNYPDSDAVVGGETSRVCCVGCNEEIGTGEPVLFVGTDRLETGVLHLEPIHFGCRERDFGEVEG